MNGCFHTPFDPNAHLTIWKEELREFRLDGGTAEVTGQAAENLSDSDGADPIVFLLEGSQRGTR